MPLLDHFHPPWSVWRPWDGFFAAWTTTLAFRLSDNVLPIGYYAMPMLDTADLAENSIKEKFEVQVLRQAGGPQLRAVIELVSPGNKDRPSSRRAFTEKCAGYLRRGVSVIFIDVVTERTANFHADLLHALGSNGTPPWESPTKLYAAAYRRGQANGQSELDAWPEPLALGQPLPTLPMWLEVDLCVPLRLEESYSVTCGSLRMPG